MELPDGVAVAVFDLDGTLADLAIDYAALRSELRSLLGTGDPLSPLLPAVRRLAGGDPGLLARALGAIDRREAEAAARAAPNEGAARLYREARGQGAAVVILTRNGRRAVDAFLRSSGLPPPDMVVARDDVFALKPDAAHLAPVLARFGPDPGRYVLVGDSSHDRELAARAGIRFVDAGGERERLERVAESHDYGAGFNGTLIGLRFRAIRPYLGTGRRVLELGPAGGEMTRLLREVTDRLTVVDGSEAALERVRERVPDAEAVCSLFERLDLGRRFDAVLLCHVLEHVADPAAVLGAVRGCCHARTRVVVTVPNAFSLHRLLGVEMGLLADPHELNDSDRAVGHRRVYDPRSLEKDLRRAGYRVVARRGVMLKPLDNARMGSLSPEQVEGLYRLGDRFPDNCAELVAVCRKA